MKWVSRDGKAWIQRKKVVSAAFPHVLELSDLKVDLEPLDPNEAIKLEAKVTLERCDNAKQPTPVEDDFVSEDVADVVEKANQDFLDDLDEGLEDINSNEDEDEWMPEGVVKPRIHKHGGFVFGKKPKSQGSSGKRFRNPAYEPRGEMSEYEKIRLKNIEEQRKLFNEMVEAAQELKPKIPRRPCPIRRRTTIVPYSTRTEPIQLRSRHVTGSSDSDSGISSGISTPTKRRRFDFDEDDEYKCLPSKKRRSAPQRWIKNPNVDVATPDDITDEMLDNVCDYVSEKVYNTVNGTSCHQCRQKTLDTKTVCRSGVCHGVRGAFCGVCLKNRYGQDAREALKDPNWTCPPCQDKCNCSICRNRNGKGATGILTGLALSKGHKSVAHYLDHLVNAKGNDEYDEE